MMKCRPQPRLPYDRGPISSRMRRPKLALAIPTFRRADTLEHNLTAIVDEAKALGIPIHVCDDAPDDRETEERVLRVAKRYPAITYERNSPTLGHDANLIKTLSLPDSDFVWLLADSLLIKPGELTRIHDRLLDEDFLFLNAIVDDEDADRYRDASSRTILRDLFWNQSLTGATVYHRRVIDWVRLTRPAIQRNFPQLSIILDYSSQHEAKIGWVAEKTMISLPKKSYWRSKSVFQNWIDDWASAVLAYPRIIGPQDRSTALRAHATGTGIFSPLNLIRYRAEGQLTYRAVKREHFWDVVPIPRAVVLTILLIPQSVAAMAVALKRGLGRVAVSRRW